MLVNFISASLYVGLLLLLLLLLFGGASVGEFYLVVCYMSCFPIILLNFVEGHGELI